MQEATYSDYTCYTGIADFVPADIDTVGYDCYLPHSLCYLMSQLSAMNSNEFLFETTEMLFAGDIAFSVVG